VGAAQTFDHLLSFPVIGTAALEPDPWPLITDH